MLSSRVITGRVSVVWYRARTENLSKIIAGLVKKERRTFFLVNLLSWNVERQNSACAATSVEFEYLKKREFRGV